MLAASTLLVLSAASLARAAVTPLTPTGAPEVGSQIDIQWDTDSSGDWTDCQIDFMSGDNWNMLTLETIATGLDCTKQDSLSWTIPDVTIYADIYFFQFTVGGNVSTAVWTTRFPIASAAGSTSAAPESIQPDGQTIGWGSGALVGQASTPSGDSAGASATNSGSVTSDASSTTESSSKAGDKSSSSITRVRSTTSAAAQETTSSSTAAEDSASSVADNEETESTEEPTSTSALRASTSQSAVKENADSSATAMASATGLALALAGCLLSTLL